MFSKLNRPYKKSNAKDTINKIKNILERLDLSPNEVFSGNPYPEIYSMRIELPYDKGGFGTNGKGRTIEYSIASGYAEFMERIQNNLYASLPRTMLMNLKAKHGFYYVPDEKYLNYEEILSLPSDILDDLVSFKDENKKIFLNSYYNRLTENGIEGFVSIPFYDTKNNKLTYLPYNLLLMAVGSNGMAAGNTVSEAIFQAICELMERWAASEIFYKQLTPPTVPDEYLKEFNEEYAVIKNIEKDGKYKVIIKDFSANKRIPSVGIIVINKENNKYKLNVGSDTSFQVALSRCITEVYQGTENIQAFNESLKDIPKEIPDYFLSDNKESKLKQYLVFSDFTMDASGVYPPSLFSETPSYSFDPSVFTTKESYEKEVSYLISRFHNEGYNVYIRDCSYLGFPSVMVYIPEVSALGKKNVPKISKSSKFNQIELDKAETLLFNATDLSESDLSILENILSGFSHDLQLSKIFNIVLKQNSFNGIYQISFFLTLLRYRLGKYDKALESLKEFTSKGTGNDAYYKIVGEYFKLKKSGHTNIEVENTLLNLNYDKNLVSEVCLDLSDEKNIFKNITLPKCPNCKSCNLSTECLTMTQSKVCDKLYVEMKNNLINQNNLYLLLN